MNLPLPTIFLALLMLLSCLGAECFAQRRAKETNVTVNTELSGNDCKPANESGDQNTDQDERSCEDYFPRLSPQP